MKKIVIFIPSFHIGGVERVMVSVANYLFAGGYPVTLLVAKEEGELQTFVNKNIEVVCLGNVKLRNSLRPLICYLKSANPDFILCGPDFVNLITIVAHIFLQSKTKVIISQHCYFDIETKRLGLHGKLIPWGMKIFYPRAYRIVAVSDGIKEMLLKYGLPNNKIVRIYNPVDIQSVVCFASEKTEIELPSNYIVYVGRLSYVKNIPLLLRAFALFRKQKSVSLVIIGEGTEKERLLLISRELGIERDVIFCGGLGNPFPILAKARLAVLPSFSESFGSVIVEAMALGVTSVATPTLGVREISEDGKFVYLSGDNPDEISFARLLEYAYEHPMDASLLYKRSLEFDPGKVIGLYRDLLN